jgi:SAM-dependent methyltransferase/uncharacterized protein YbaR (Trm112 family)
MRRNILSILCCPDCKHDLKLIERDAIDGTVFSGLLECGNCGKSFDIISEVPRMMLGLGDREDLSESWGYQWAIQAEGKLETDTYYGETEEQEVDNFFRYFGITPGDLKGKTVLDAGCGCGRLTKALGKYGAEIVGIDIASSIEYIHRYCQSEKNVHIIQADIVNLPFKSGSFDYVWSKLAVCYAHDPQQAFGSLAALLKPSGRLFISVPDKADLSFVVKLKDLLRITHLIPRRLLLYLCWAFAPALALIKKITRSPASSVRANAFFLFNALHPSFMTRHSEEEVKDWFHKLNFDEIAKVDGMPRLIHVRGTRRNNSSEVPFDTMISAS